MNRSESVFPPHLEWEALQFPWDIHQITVADGLPEGTHSISLRRGRAYSIKSTAFGMIADFDALRGEHEAGHLVTPIRAEGVDKFGYNYALVDGYVNRAETIPGGEDGTSTAYKARLGHLRVERSRPDPPPACWLTEWYLNGPNMPMIYSRVTQRELRRSYRRDRDLIDTASYFDDRRESSASGSDSVFVQCPRFSFLVQQGPNGFGPKWSHNIGIEYRQDWGGIPTPEEREAIAEIVGFVVGRRLLNVGFTSFDKDGYPVTEMVRSPLGDNVVTVCQGPDHAPINIVPPMGGQQMEQVLQTLAPSYLEQRTSLRLPDALWRYSLSREVAVGIDLPIVASAIEGIAASWLNRHGVKRVYMEKVRFEELLADELASMEIKLRAEAALKEAEGEHKAEGTIVRYPDQIMNNIRGSFGMSGNASLTDFLDRLGLQIGAFEKKAIRARNPMAHGTFITPEEESEIEMTLRQRSAYHTLFARILLKLLGYDGPYIDRSAHGFPEKHVSEPQAGV